CYFHFISYSAHLDLPSFPTRRSSDLLAKTSSRPGKTQLINHFKINNNWFLVDLPGYGYAKVSKSVKATFQKFITEYFEHRKQLRSEEHTSELQSRENLVCRLLLEKKN